MATVNFLNSKAKQSRAGLTSILAYCMREDKTMHNDRQLVTGVNCVAQSALTEMMNTKSRYRKTNGKMYYHLVQSFHPEERVTPEMAHAVAVEYAQSQFPNFEVLVATHVDAKHIHSHLVVNSVSFEDGRKYHSDAGNIERLRAASDELCLKYGLSVIEKRQKKKAAEDMLPKEYRSAERVESWKMALTVTIEDCMKQARSKEHFISLMREKGYDVKWTDARKNITYTTPSGMKCRDSKLHEPKFLKEAMEYEFRIREEIAAGAEEYGAAEDDRERYRDSTQGFEAGNAYDGGSGTPLYSADGEDFVSDRADGESYRLSGWELERAAYLGIEIESRGTAEVYQIADSAQYSSTDWLDVGSNIASLADDVSGIVESGDGDPEEKRRRIEAMQRAEAWGTVIGVGAGLAIAAIRKLRQENENRVAESNSDDQPQAVPATQVQSSSDYSIFDRFGDEECEEGFDEESLYEENYDDDEDEDEGMTMSGM